MDRLEMKSTQNKHVNSQLIKKQEGENNSKLVQQAPRTKRYGQGEYKVE